MRDLTNYEYLPWLFMDKDTGSIEALPMPDVIGLNKFILTAKDVRGAISKRIHVNVEVLKPSLKAVTQVNSG